MSDDDFEVGLPLSAFSIGMEFYTPTGKWRCTDVGSRVAVAIKLDQEDPRNYNGPPFSILNVCLMNTTARPASLSLGRIDS